MSLSNAELETSLGLPTKFAALIMEQLHRSEQHDFLPDLHLPSPACRSRGSDGSNSIGVATFDSSRRGQTTDSSLRRGFLTAPRTKQDVGPPLHYGMPALCPSPNSGAQAF